MDSISSVLKLKNIVFEKIEFQRKGFKNSNNPSFTISVQIGKNKADDYKVTLTINVDKEDEYYLTISLTGFFSIEDDEKNTDNELKREVINDLINKNAVAILMPYLRSEVTLLTSQPEMDSIVLPPFNINKLMQSRVK